LANGTNRIGVASQSIAASSVFYKHGKTDFSKNKICLITTTLGALVGVWVATNVSNEQFMTVFSYLMVFMLVVLIAKPERWLRETDTNHSPSLWITVPAFLALGFYGGFIQMGMGIFFLAVMVLIARYSLLDANVVKSLMVAIYTILVILIFQGKGLIDWKIGAIMAGGQTIGGYTTAQFASKNESANKWAHRLLIIIVVLAIVRLFDWHLFIFKLLE
jgi:hypothetical protein